MSQPREQRAFLIKAEVLEMMEEGYLLRYNPNGRWHGPWMDHPDKKEWNHYGVHGNSFRALKKEGSIKLARGRTYWGLA